MGCLFLCRRTGALACVSDGQTKLLRLGRKRLLPQDTAGGGCVTPWTHTFAAVKIPIFSTAYPCSTQESSPPCSGRTRVMPRFFSCSATRALVASLGQVQ